MVQIKSILTTLLALAPLASSQELFTPIDYEGSLDIYYYFRDSDARVVPSTEGVTVEGTFSSTKDLVTTLNNALIVYSINDGPNVLLTANCYNVYKLVDRENKPIIWDSCIEFPFYKDLAASIGTENELVLTTVTTTIDNTITTYTTFCPLSEETSFTPTPIGYTTYTSAITKDGIVSTSTVESAIHAVSGAPACQTVTDIASYEAQVAAASASTANRANDIPVTTKQSNEVSGVASEAAEETASTTKPAKETVNGATGTVAGGSKVTTITKTGVATINDAQTVTVNPQGAAQAKETGTTVFVGGAPVKTSAQQQATAGSTSPAVSVFEGQAAKIVGSLSIIYVIGSFVSFLF